MELPAVQIGSKFMKFIFFRPPDKFYFSTEGKEPWDIPLFLGTDVLAGSSVLQKNFSRVHARYGKEGFASLLKLNDISIEGIPNSSSLWFYTVQGLFKVSFEYLGINAQKHCLTLLTETWLATSELPKLDNNLDLHLLPEALEVQLLQSLKTADSGQSLEMVSPTSSNNQEFINARVNESDIEIGTHKNDNSMCAVISHSDTIETSLEVTEQVVNHSDTDCKDFMELLKVLTEYITSHESVHSSKDSSYISNLLIMLKLLRTEYLNDEVDCGIPFSIIEQYCNLNEQSSCEHEKYENDFGISVKTNMVICLFCEWIGKVFNSLTPIIAAKAEKFKVENIDRVHNLPKAESLIDILFPQSMKILLLNWMSLPDTVAEQDHTYSPPNKKAKGENLLFKKPVFPFIQIILEFANSALVSGVAHVIHTRLLHDNS